MKNKITFEFAHDAGIYAGGFNDGVDDNVCYINYSDCQTDKPMYLGILARAQQLQPILDNPQLFDPNFVNAIRVLMMHYTNTSFVE